ncbi:hypothetical protein VP01_879g4 [Puccinia sorghi]|uniref:Uncharacterized protein n=1 Tax=Puccinia sorghi TaxID=27349 RepID=A0A0L6U953_9BASI|nr:hypothetical protein VP01_879g4 [Puccinia sorghi]
MGAGRSCRRGAKLWVGRCGKQTWGKIGSKSLKITKMQNIHSLFLGCSVQRAKFSAVKPKGTRQTSEKDTQLTTETVFLSTARMSEEEQRMGRWDDKRMRSGKTAKKTQENRLKKRGKPTILAERKSENEQGGTENGEMGGQVDEDRTCHIVTAAPAHQALMSPRPNLTKARRQQHCFEPILLVNFSDHTNMCAHRFSHLKLLNKPSYLVWDAPNKLIINLHWLASYDTSNFMQYLFNFKMTTKPNSIKLNATKLDILWMSCHTNKHGLIQYQLLDLSELKVSLYVIHQGRCPGSLSQIYHQGVFLCAFWGITFWGVSQRLLKLSRFHCGPTVGVTDRSAHQDIYPQDGPVPTIHIHSQYSRKRRIQILSIKLTRNSAFEIYQLFFLLGEQLIYPLRGNCLTEFQYKWSLLSGLTIFLYWENQYKENIYKKKSFFKIELFQSKLIEFMVWFFALNIFWTSDSFRSDASPKSYLDSNNQCGKIHGTRQQLCSSGNIPAGSIKCSMRKVARVSEERYPDDMSLVETKLRRFIFYNHSGHMVCSKCPYGALLPLCIDINTNFCVNHDIISHLIWHSHMFTLHRKQSNLSFKNSCECRGRCDWDEMACIYSGSLICMVKFPKFRSVTCTQIQVPLILHALSDKKAVMVSGIPFQTHIWPICFSRFLVAPQGIHLAESTNSYAHIPLRISKTNNIIASTIFHLCHPQKLPYQITEINQSHLSPRCKPSHNDPFGRASRKRMRGSKQQDGRGFKTDGKTSILPLYKWIGTEFTARLTRMDLRKYYFRKPTSVFFSFFGDVTLVSQSVVVSRLLEFICCLAVNGRYNLWFWVEIEYDFFFFYGFVFSSQPFIRPIRREKKKLPLSLRRLCFPHPTEKLTTTNSASLSLSLLSSLSSRSETHLTDNSDPRLKTHSFLIISRHLSQSSN